ncbi:CapA family protein [Bdellovibrio sp. SKB1291214]|uniref:CapA family protein n=1 Tax=Bdellovibrio sp. SKB1291214 TaxID=1732569 RepID=UPI00223F6D91|nr:CapA family protein [Bdellovibrio sp. SKB1291214]UYL07471.1 CapA family protein [Bdellovibrio sp. SKB1291214]
MKILWIVLSALSFSLSAIAAEESFVTISAVGDVMLGTDYPTDKLPNDQGRKLFKYSEAYIKTGDIRFANFEGTLFDGSKGAGSKSEGANRHLFRTPTEFARTFANAGFNVVSLANNHAMDFGVEGLYSTQQTLRSYQIQYSTKRGAEVAQFTVRGIRVALIATDFYPGPRSISAPEKTYQEIRELKKRFDVVIVSSHAGGEGSDALRTPNQTEYYMGENRGNSVAFARGAIDAGASLIIMHGPHVPRGLEVYKGHLVVYSMGNFATERGINILGTAGLAPLLLIKLDPKGKFQKGSITSFVQNREQGVIYDKTMGAFKLMQSLSYQDFAASAPQFDSTTSMIYPR